MSRQMGVNACAWSFVDASEPFILELKQAVEAGASLCSRVVNEKPPETSGVSVHLFDGNIMHLSSGSQPSCTFLCICLLSLTLLLYSYTHVVDQVSCPFIYLQSLGSPIPVPQLGGGQGTPSSPSWLVSVKVVLFEL